MPRRREPPVGILSDLVRHERKTGQLRPAEAEYIGHRSTSLTWVIVWRTDAGAVIEQEVPRFVGTQTRAIEQRAAFFGIAGGVERSTDPRKR